MHNKFTNIARTLRKNFTETERLLWKHIRQKQLDGYKFRRQQPIGQYIVDFVNFERKIIIELDGGQHTEIEKDKERDKFLRDQGFKVLRFWNHEVFENVEGVLEVIKKNLLPPSPSSPPTRGVE
jgi:very-short-patch-repair endonuclease